MSLLVNVQNAIMPKLSLLLTLVILMSRSSVQSQAGLQRQCYLTNKTETSFVISSYVNQTGHWISQVVSHQGKKLGQRPWSVAIVQKTEECDGVEILHTTTTITAPPPKAGPGYVFYPGVGYYKLHAPLAKTWERASETCVSEDGHLAIINSEAEQKILVQILALHSYKAWVFMGFKRSTGRQFVTIFDENVSSTGFVRWGAGEPGDTEHCGSMHPTTGLLNDIGCETQYGFLCEQELF